MEQFASSPITHEIIEWLIEQGEIEQLRQLLESIHPTDIAHLLDDLSPEDGVTVFELLPVEVGSEVLDETHSLVRQQLVEKLDDEHLADLLEELPMDDAS
jgi:magnesium transporter